MPLAGTVWRWADQDRDGFSGRYRTARWFGQPTVLDEMLEIADDSRNDWIVQRRRDGDRLVFNRGNVMWARLRIQERRRLFAGCLCNGLVAPDEGRDVDPPREL